MSTPPIDSPVGSFEVRCRVGQFVMDSDDPDRAPDLVPVGGTVTIEPDLRRPIRVMGESGPRVVGVDPLEFTIDPATGKLIHPDGEPGVELIDPTDEHLDPQGWTYTANVRPEKGRSWTVTFGAPADDSGIVDLGSVVSVAPSPGNPENYLQQTIVARDQAGSFAVRAETAAQDAEDWAPTFAWDGTRLVIDGDTGPDLQGPPVGGIDDVPGLQDALPVVDTTAGARVSVGDVMIHGTTGWRDLTPYLVAGVTPSSNIPDARFRRVDDMVEFAMKVDLADDFTGNVICAFPTGFRAPSFRYLPGAYTGAGVGAGASNMTPISMIGYVASGDLQTPFSKRLPAGSTLIWAGRFDTNDPWPVTLPGDPA